jgi:hypothetical protein
VGAGIIGGLGLILVEILYHKHKIRKEKRADAAQMAITKWKGTIEVMDRFSVALTVTSLWPNGAVAQEFFTQFFSNNFS